MRTSQSITAAIVVYAVLSGCAADDPADDKANEPLRGAWYLQRGAEYEPDWVYFGAHGRGLYLRDNFQCFEFSYFRKDKYLTIRPDMENSCWEGNTINTYEVLVVGQSLSEVLTRTGRVTTWSRTPPTLTPPKPPERTSRSHICWMKRIVKSPTGLNIYFDSPRVISLMHADRTHENILVTPDEERSSRPDLKSAPFLSTRIGDQLFSHNTPEDVCVMKITQVDGITGVDASASVTLPGLTPNSSHQFIEPDE